ncbi:MAG: TatD family hydrolase [Candidatus Aenigmarchaeota archaeon]|nr:TatD family hydrolase [Candidatus Aenigmarchaeota archaeon]
MLIDSHCHLASSQFDPDREVVIRRAIENNVKYMISVGFDLDGCKKTVELAENYDSVYAVIGIHPHNAKDVDTETYSTLKELAKSKKVIAYGEIGLDFYRNLSPRKTQLDKFYEQIKVAKELGLPLVIHDREAHEETLDALRESNMNGVIHCFSGDYELAKKFIDLGFYISIPTTVTYKNNLRLHEVVKKFPLDRILIETDAPALAPEPYRNKRNEPAWVKYAAKKIAELKELTFEQVVNATSKNTKTIFKIE